MKTYVQNLLAALARAFSSGARSTPRHCVSTRARAELRPGPRGGIFFIGGLTRKFSTEQTRKASGQEKLKRLNLRQVLRPIYCLK